MLPVASASVGPLPLGSRTRGPVTAASLGFALLVWLVLLAPLGALLAHLSPSALRSALEAPGALDPLAVSLEAGGATLGILLLLGTPAAWLLAHHRLPGHRLFEGALLASLLLPPLVVGLLLVFLVGPLTPLGSALGRVGLTATNTFFALVVAEVYESAPYYLLAAQAAFASVDPALEQQAALLGDPPRRTWRRVSLPLAAPGLAAALAIVWARAMGAFGAVLIVAYHPYGLPMEIWTSLQTEGLASALPFALVLLLVALPLPLAAFAWSSRARRRALG